MPSELELAAARKALRQACPGMGEFTARIAATAALEAAEKVRIGSLAADERKRGKS